MACLENVGRKCENLYSIDWKIGSKEENCNMVVKNNLQANYRIRKLGRMKQKLLWF